MFVDALVSVSTIKPQFMSLLFLPVQLKLFVSKNKNTNACGTTLTIFFRVATGEQIVGGSCVKAGRCKIHPGVKRLNGNTIH